MEFLEADQLYLKGDEPEAALQRYRAIVADGANEHYVTLSRFKIAQILERQLMQYETV